MSYSPQNPNGQGSKANSSPVVLCTEQEAKIDLLSTSAGQALQSTVVKQNDIISLLSSINTNISSSNDSYSSTIILM